MYGQSFFLKIPFRQIPFMQKVGGHITVLNKTCINSCVQQCGGLVQFVQDSLSPQIPISYISEKRNKICSDHLQIGIASNQLRNLINLFVNQFDFQVCQS